MQVYFLDDGTVMDGDVRLGRIEQGPSGLWRFWEQHPEGEIPWREYYPNHAVAEIAVRAHLESYGDPEYGSAHHDG